MNTIGNISLLIPEFILCSGFVGTMILAASPLKKGKEMLPFLTAAILLFSGAWVMFDWGKIETPFFSMAVIDNLSRLFKLFFLLSAILTLFLFAIRKSASNKPPPEFYPIFMCMVLGMNLAAMANHLMFIVISLEIISISAYVLVAGFLEKTFSSEAAIKYFLFGAFVTGLSVFGISWFYGLTGDFFSNAPGVLLSLSTFHPIGVAVIFILILSLIAFKLSAAPFHFWIADVFQSIPWPLAAFFSVAPKAAACVVLYRFFSPLAEHPFLGKLLFFILLAFSVVSILIGNLSALRQKNVFRLLAFSGVAQSGFILLGFLFFSAQGFSAVMYYLVAYLFMNVGMFAMVGFVSDSTGSDSIESWKKIRLNGGFHLAFIILFAASLTGLPGTAGFTGKLSLFLSLFQTEGFLGLRVATLIFALLNILLALVYYFKMPVYLFSASDEGKTTLNFTRSQRLFLFFMAVPVVWLGIFHFDRLLDFFRNVIEIMH